MRSNLIINQTELTTAPGKYTDLGFGTRFNPHLFGFAAANAERADWDLRLVNAEVFRRSARLVRVCLRAALQEGHDCDTAGQIKSSEGPVSVWRSRVLIPSIENVLKSGRLSKRGRGIKAAELNSSL